MELNRLPTSRHTYQQLDDELDPPSVGNASGTNLAPRHSPDQTNGNVHTQQVTEPFDPLDQSLTLFLKQSVRWLGTAILIISILVTLKIYETKGNFSPTQKDLFNTINIALNLGLSLNFFVSQTLNLRPDRWALNSLIHIRVRSKIQPGYCDGSSGHGRGLPSEKKT